MSFSITIFGFLLFALVSAQEFDLKTNGTVKETIYDITLYVTLPASIIMFGLFVCLCYCILCSTRVPDQTNRTFQPIVVSNRNTPLVVSSKTVNHNEEELVVKTVSDHKTSKPVVHEKRQTECNKNPDHSSALQDMPDIQSPGLHPQTNSTISGSKVPIAKFCFESPVTLNLKPSKTLSLKALSSDAVPKKM